MKRRNFISSSIAIVVGGALWKKKKEHRLLTPTHTVEAKSEIRPTEGVRFPCILKSDNELKVDSVVKVDWEKGGMEEFIVTKIKDTKNQHVEEFNVREEDA